MSVFEGFSFGFGEFGLGKKVSVSVSENSVSSFSGHVRSSNKVKSSNKVRLSNKFFTVDVVSQLAGLVQVDNMGDEEVEHVVTSLASLTTKIKT